MAQSSTIIKCYHDKEYAFELHKNYVIKLLRELYPKEFNDNDFDESVIKIIFEYEYLNQNDYYTNWSIFNMPLIIENVFGNKTLIFIKSLYLISNMFFIITLILYLYIWFIHCNQDINDNNIEDNNNIDNIAINDQKQFYENRYFTWYNIAENLEIEGLKLKSAEKHDYEASLTVYIIHLLSYLLIEQTPKTYNNIYHSIYKINYILSIWYIFEIFKNGYFYRINLNISSFLSINFCNIKPKMSSNQLYLYSQYKNYFHIGYIGTHLLYSNINSYKMYKLLYVLTFDKALVCIIFFYYTTTFWGIADIANYSHEIIQSFYAEWIIKIVMSYTFYPILISGIFIINLAKIIRIIVADIFIIYLSVACIIKLFYPKILKVKLWSILLNNLCILLFILSIQSSALVVIIGIILIIYNIFENNKQFIMGIKIEMIGILFGIPYTSGIYSNQYLRMCCVFCCVIGIALQFGSFHYKICRTSKHRDVFEYIAHKVKLITKKQKQS